MNESQWQQAEAPFPMLVYLQGDAGVGQVQMYSEGEMLAEGPSQRISPQGIRDFAGACCQRLAALPLNEVSGRALAVFLRFTRGEIPRDEADRQLTTLDRISVERRERITLLPALAAFRRDDASSAADCASNAVWVMAFHVARERLAEEYSIHDAEDLCMWGFDGPPDPVWRRACVAEERAQAELLREIAGNPFQTHPVDPAWLQWKDQTVARLAEQIHAQDAFDLLPVLADALEEAGCSDADLIAHCRRAGGHVHGCWAVQALRSGRAT